MNRRRLVSLLAAVALLVMMMPVVANAQPLIPHSTEDRPDCLMCHESGVAGAPKFPDNHIGRTNSMCTMCHQQASAMTPGAAAAATPTATPPPVLGTGASGAAATPTPAASTVPSTGDEMPIAALGFVGLLMAAFGWGLRRHFQTG